jgi:hypothetical protein
MLQAAPPRRGDGSPDSSENLGNAVSSPRDTTPRTFASGDDQSGAKLPVATACDFTDLPVRAASVVDQNALTGGKAALRRFLLEDLAARCRDGAEKSNCENGDLPHGAPLMRKLATLSLFTVRL